MMRRILGESVRGYTHIQRELECQDSKDSLVLEDGTVILSVVDGHGSRSCPYSRLGAELATKTFCALADGLCHGFQKRQDRLSDYLNHEGSLRFAQEVERAWKGDVLHCHRTLGRDIPLTEAGAENEAAVYRLYGTTLLGLVIARDFVFAFQIGDGDITYVDGGGSQPVVQADKLLGVESHSLCSADAWKRAVSAVHFRDRAQKEPYAFLLSTDGFSNSYADDAAFGETCRQYFEALITYGPDAVAENLPEWLSETSRLGCGDDTTLLIAYFAPGEETNKEEIQ